MEFIWNGAYILEHLHLATFFILIPLGFLAAFVDSSVGGGGLISLPALMLAGLPPSLALGTNKLAGTMSAIASTWSYFRSGKVNLQLTKFLLPLSLIGAIVGADLVHHLPTGFLKPLVIILLIVVTIYTIVKKDLGREKTYRKAGTKLLFGACATALIIGFYDGFFGPGTGSFLIISFVFMGFDFVEASGNAKALNLASNFGALGTFIFMESINYAFGLVLGISMIFGAIVGSQFAIRKGVAYVRPIFIIVTCFMIGQQAWKYFNL